MHPVHQSRGAPPPSTGPPHAANAVAATAAAAAPAVPSALQPTKSAPQHRGSFGSPPAPRTVFDTQQTARAKTAADCRAPGCFARSEIGGCCIKHYYRSNTAARNGSPGSGSAASPPPAAAAVCLSPTSSATAAAARKAEEERRQLCEELVATEKSYGRGLKAVVRGMMLRLAKYEELAPDARPLMDRDEIARVFMNLKDIFDLQQKLHAELKQLRFQRELLGPQLGKVLLTYTPFFKLYASYVNGYEASQELLRRLREERPQLDAFFRHCELCEGGRISDFMIQPVQRVPRYALLLRAIEKVTAPSDGSLGGIRTALAGVEAVALDINESFRRAEARARVLEIAAHIEGISAEELVTPHRFFVKDGPLDKKYNHSQFRLSEWNAYHFFLFSDLLLYTTLPSAKGFCKLKYSLPLHDTDVADVAQAQVDHAFEVRGPVKAFVVRAASAADKAAWMTAIADTKAALTKNSATLRVAKPTASGSATGAPATPSSVSRSSLGSPPPPVHTPTYSSQQPLPGQPPLPPGRPPISVTSPPSRGNGSQR